MVTETTMPKIEGFIPREFNIAQPSTGTSDNGRFVVYGYSGLLNTTNATARIDVPPTIEPSGSVSTSATSLILLDTGILESHSLLGDYRRWDGVSFSNSTLSEVLPFLSVSGTLYQPGKVQSTAQRRFTLPSVEDYFVLRGGAVISAFINQNNLTSALLEAIPRLNECFGKTAIKSLSLLIDDEGSTSLFCLVSWSSDLAAAQEALRSFDQKWWRKNARRVGSKLNFDFELC
jgi:hypothetical protein